VCYRVPVTSGTATNSAAEPGARATRFRVTVVGPTPPLRGGIAHYTTALVRALRLRHAVQVVGLRRQYPRLLFPGTSEMDRSGVAIELRPDALVDPLSPWTWPAVANAIRAFAPEVIVLAWWQPALGAVLASFARLARRRSRARLLFLCHNVAAHDATPLDRILLRYALGAADAAIVHSAADRERLQHYRTDLRSLRTTHPAYDLLEFGPPLPVAEARARLGLAGDVVLFFGLVRRYKGLADLLRAMPLILAARPCTLVVAGEFYEPRQPYEALARELGIAAQVRLLDGYVPNEEVGVYFSAADVVVAPYRSGTQSGVVALAQRFRRPVVASRVGGLPDMIVDGVSGLTVPPGDPDSLARAVLRIYEEGAETWRARVGEIEVTTWDEEVDAIEKLAGG
jgi:glycosyltransferase involved in cell wall biosynthesis